MSLFLLLKLIESRLIKKISPHDKLSRVFEFSLENEISFHPQQPFHSLSSEDHLSVNTFLNS